MDGSKQWYVLYTQAGQEKKVREILTHRKIENYYPLNKIVWQWNGRKTIAHEPLFSSYVFIRISKNQLSHLKQISGVINFVYWLNKPAVISEGEIEMIKRILNGHTNIKLEKTFKIPGMENRGQVFSTKNKTVKITLPSLGYSMIAGAETENEEALIRTIAAQTGLAYPLYAIK